MENLSEPFAGLNSVQKTILRMVQREGRISRTSIAKTCGISMPTVSRTTKRLIDEGYLCEVDVGESCGGRKPVILEMNDKYGYIITVDFECSNLEYAVFDFKCECVFGGRIIVRRKAYLESLFQAIDDAIDVIHTRYNREPLCISLGAHGLLNEETGTIRRSVSFGWKNVPLRDIVAQRYHLPVNMQLNLQMTAYGEWYFGEYWKKGVNSFATCVVGNGVGCGVILDSAIVRGSGAAGEIGMMLTGIKNKQGAFYTLEELAGGQRLIELAKERWADPRNVYLKGCTGDDPSDVYDKDIIEAIRLGDDFALDLLSETVPYIGMAVVTILRTYDPGLVVLSGLYSELGDALLQPVYNWLYENVDAEDLKRTRVEISKMRKNACVHGAAYIAYNQMFGNADVQEAGTSAHPVHDEA